LLRELGHLNYLLRLTSSPALLVSIAEAQPDFRTLKTIDCEVLTKGFIKERRHSPLQGLIHEHVLKGMLWRLVYWDIVSIHQQLKAIVGAQKFHEIRSEAHTALSNLRLPLIAQAGKR
jgi:hypothetical protein